MRKLQVWGYEGCRLRYAEDCTISVRFNFKEAAAESRGVTVGPALAGPVKRWAQCPLTRAPILREAVRPAELELVEHEVRELSTAECGGCTMAVRCTSCRRGRRRGSTSTLWNVCEKSRR